MNIQSRINKLNARIYPQHLFYAPKFIVLGVNNVCNLHCKMCDVGTQNLDSNFAVNLVGSKPLNMPLDLLKKAIDETAQYFPTSKLAYAFTEPLVYPQLMESLAYANEKGMHTVLTTNALSLPQKAEKLVNAGLNQINISLDGLEEIHNEIRGNKKSFQKAIEGIKKLKSFPGSPEIHVICAITEWNYDSLYDFASYFNSLDIDGIGFMHTQFTTHEVAHMHNEIWGDTYPATDSNIDIIDFSNMDLNVLQEQIQLIKRAQFSFEVFFSPDLTEAHELHTFYHQPEVFMGRRCNEIFQSIMLKSNGEVIPAHGRCFNLTIGNLYEQDIKEIWNSGVMKQFRQTMTKAGGLLPACARCCSGYGK